ncbi:MAG TPA: phosphonate ABC transporter substrate-binding protein [Stellaceae bacterium]|nr:phosphonate ABC transporter substrate-binding protein [Stellaceae bacterium]
MMIRRTLFATIAAAAVSALFAATPAHADWHDQVKELRVGLIGGENAGDQLARYTDFKAYLEKKLNVPVKLFQASDYAGVMQAFSAGQLDLSPNMGAAIYAATWIDTNGGIEPIVVAKELDGSTGYYSVLYCRADSPYKSIDDLKGKSIAYADPNSTSGFLVPASEFRGMGKDPTKFFSKTSFGGGHEQAVVAVMKGQYDAGFTWISGQGKMEDGYTRGNLRSMVDKKMLSMDQIRILWQSRLIPNGPVVVRKDLPADLKAELTKVFLALKDDQPKMYVDINQGDGAGYATVTHEFYQPVVDMKRAEADIRRGG